MREVAAGVCPIYFTRGKILRAAAQHIPEIGAIRRSGEPAVVPKVHPPIKRVRSASARQPPARYRACLITRAKTMAHIQLTTASQVIRAPGYPREGNPAAVDLHGPELWGAACRVWPPRSEGTRLN